MNFMHVLLKLRFGVFFRGALECALVSKEIEGLVSDVLALEEICSLEGNRVTLERSSCQGDGNL